ncbi:MAG: epoxyqueuosine reductase, partial [Akkermansia sp.]
MSPLPDFPAESALQALRYAAEQLGFSAVGVAPADADQGDRLANWLADGCHGDMEWMQRHLPARLNPQMVLPGVRSVVILTYEYARADARTAAGGIARYAQGEDYHKLLAPKLADLDETLQWYGGQQRCFADSGPVSERFFAARAGLGWIGRNGLLIRPDRGSYCFLASILTTLTLPCGTPMHPHCGNCRRCEQACPTGALREG